MTEQGEVPEYYADQFRVTTGVYGLTLTLSLSPPHPEPSRPIPPRDLVRLRMSLEHAKVMTMILRRQLRQFESENRLTIQIPASVYNALGLSPEDW